MRGIVMITAIMLGLMLCDVLLKLAGARPMRKSPLRAPSCCPHCYDERDCSSVEICRAVDDTYAGRPL